MENLSFSLSLTHTHAHTHKNGHKHRSVDREIKPNACIHTRMNVSMHTCVNKWKQIQQHTHQRTHTECLSKHSLRSHQASFTAQLTAASWCLSQQKQPGLLIITLIGSGFERGNPFLSSSLTPFFCPGWWTVRGTFLHALFILVFALYDCTATL